jgi:hypothetical protein
MPTDPVLASRHVGEQANGVLIRRTRPISVFVAMQIPQPKPVDKPGLWRAAYGEFWVALARLGSSSERFSWALVFGSWLVNGAIGLTV